MRLSALRLGEALAGRLNAVVPSPIRVSIEPPSSVAGKSDADVIVRVSNGAQLWGGQGFSSVDLRPRDENSLGDVACDMAVALLSGVQDSVIRILHQPWPCLSSGDLALPDGRADSACVYLWFGAAEDRAAVTLRPIALHEISLQS